MSSISKYIYQQVFQRNRNFCGIIVGKVGTGKSYSALRLAETLDKSFNIDRIVFKVEDLLKLVHDNKLPAGSVVILDEAGIAVSNRVHYMNKFNKAMGFLLQTWRSRNLILFVTCPDIAFVDAGVRKMFDAVIECQEVVKSRNIVRVDWKFIQVNPQSGKAYFHNLKNSMENISLEVAKPSTKLVHAYEKKKFASQDDLYQGLSDSLVPIKKEAYTNPGLPRCPKCNNIGRWLERDKVFKCPICATRWKKQDIYIEPANSLTIIAQPAKIKEKGVKQ